MLTLKSINFEQQVFQQHQLKQAHPGQSEWSIGRHPGCDLVLPGAAVSRVHGKIVYCDDTYHFIDTNSKCGSLLNGNIVTPNEKCPLHLGDLLQVGEIFLYVEAMMTPSSTVMESNGLALATFLHPEQTWSEGDLVCHCCRIIDETPDVKTFYFVADPPVLFRYKPGQFVNLEVVIDNKPVIRSYSISSSPTRPYYLALTIKRVPGPANQPDIPPGLVSNWLHDHLQVGDRVKFLGGPVGHFTCLPDLPAKLLLISAGSGITPMMSMTRWAQDTLANCDIVFLHSARTVDDIIFRQELEAIAAQMPNFRLVVTLTQPPASRPWMGFSGRISEALLNMVVPDLIQRAVYVCGPEGFMSATRALLETMQFPMQHYQEESFGSRSSRKAAAKTVEMSFWQVKPETVPLINGKGLPGDRPTVNPACQAETPRVHFQQSGQTIETDGDTPLLEIAEAAGVSIRHACRMGACGACKVRLHQGQVRYESPPAALTDKDQAAGYALACVALPVDQVILEG